MKYTIAVGILARTFPVRSELTPTNPEDLLLERTSTTTTHQNHYQDGIGGITFSRISRRIQERRKSHQKNNNNNNYRRHRRHQSRHQKQKGVLLSNGPSSFLVEQQQKQKEQDIHQSCDPFSTNPDTGILSCRSLGHECVVDETSPLGGSCVPTVTTTMTTTTTTTGRHLEDDKPAVDGCLLCEYGFTVGYYMTGMSVNIPIAGYSGKTCGELLRAAYYYLQDEDSPRSIDPSNCPTVQKAVRAAGCCAPLCDLCGIGSAAVDDDDIIVPIPSNLEGYSEEGETCTSLYSAAYYYATIGTETCPMIRQTFQDSGCCKARSCYVCNSETSFTEDYSTGSPCGKLHLGLYDEKTISAANCTSATQLAADEYCCVAIPTYDCMITCGESSGGSTLTSTANEDVSIFLPDHWIYKTGSCGVIQSQLNEEQCISYSSKLIPWCCGPPPTSETDDDDTEPSEDDDEEGEEDEESSPTRAPRSSASSWDFHRSGYTSPALLLLFFPLSYLFFGVK